MFNTEYSNAIADAQFEKQEAILVWRDAHERELAITRDECDARIREYTLSIFYSLRELKRDSFRLARAIRRRTFIWWNS